MLKSYDEQKNNNLSAVQVHDRISDIIISCLRMITNMKELGISEDVQEDVYNIIHNIMAEKIFD